ncbi:CTTNBP2 N-terminal-like protein isoform X2 [Coccinella septempunctata]|uniref:CTTNBP2 N-terminal-like protein isoform X2 n=1 Tax=Coccinella septempunctata TaxID=41139 RepID=UPI001D0633D4|nr:CTTNBP2 N-terminal-like protein isoform X2 [Coccinella septempunctata]
MNKGLHKNLLNMATNNNQNGWISGLNYCAPLSTVQEQQTGTSEINQYEQLDRPNTGCNTLKRNPKMELSKTDLLKLVTYFEGEIQARDIVIAALKSEKLKQIVNLGRYKPAVMNDPYTALLRDSIADGPNAKAPVSERDMTAAAEQQLQALEQLALQQRRAHQHMINILKEAEAKHKKVIQELEEEKCKHEHDTAQGDDITYGLEMERTRLRQELELERNGRKKLEKELKRQLEMADEERARQKQIVLLLLAERKKIIVKYIEERKRSEDLAQILSEEKSRNDTMAEGLEEESKKSLQMEAELEKQGHVFEADRRSLKSQLALKEARCLELEAEIKKLKSDCEAIRTRTNISCDTASAMISSIAKVVQPTATVSSVPVSGPTTGIAQSVIPGQVLRQTAVAPVIPATKLATQSSISAATSQGTVSRTQGKLSFQYQSNVPQTPPKKGSLAARGVPPPIPPNKPVIPIKQATPRRPETAADVEKKKVAGQVKEDHNDRSSEKSQMG